MRVGRALYNSLRDALTCKVVYRLPGNLPPVDSQTMVDLRRVPEADTLAEDTSFAPDQRTRSVARKAPAYQITVQAASDRPGAIALDHEEEAEALVDDAIRAVHATAVAECFQYEWESAGFQDFGDERKAGARYVMTLRALEAVANDNPRVKPTGFTVGINSGGATRSTTNVPEGK